MTVEISGTKSELVGRADRSVKAGPGDTVRVLMDNSSSFHRAKSSKPTQGTEAPKGRSVSQTIFHDLRRPRG